MAKSSGKKERYEVLCEEMSSKVQLVLEGHSMLDQKIEGLRQDVKGVKEELGHVEAAVTQTNQRLETLIDRFNVHERAHAG